MNPYIDPEPTDCRLLDTPRPQVPEDPIGTEELNMNPATKTFDSLSPETVPPKQKMQGLSRLLRIVGATVLMAAASVFLFQQWGAGNDVARYASLAGMTLLISIAGFLCGSRLGESKSARTLLGLVLSVCQCISRCWVVLSTARSRGMACRFRCLPLPFGPSVARWQRWG